MFFALGSDVVVLPGFYLLFTFVSELGGFKLVEGKSFLFYLLGKFGVFGYFFDKLSALRFSLWSVDFIHFVFVFGFWFWNEECLGNL